MLAHGSSDLRPIALVQLDPTLAIASWGRVKLGGGQPLAPLRRFTEHSSLFSQALTAPAGPPFTFLFWIALVRVQGDHLYHLHITHNPMPHSLTTHNHIPLWHSASLQSLSSLHISVVLALNIPHLQQNLKLFNDA